MYLPPSFKASEEVVASMLSNLGPVDLVTRSKRGLDSTLLPMIYVSGEGMGSLCGHVSRANLQWSQGEGGLALAIAHGPSAYVSPGFYPSKRADPRVVPTWNYAVLHFHGRLVIHDDLPWKLENVSALARLHEGAIKSSWAVEDAPPDWIERQLRAVVGVELVIEEMQAKAKMSQTRPIEDAQGVAEGLKAQGNEAAASMQRKVNEERIRR